VIKFVSYDGVDTRCVTTGESQRSEPVIDNVGDMLSSVDDAERRTSRLASSYYALIAWIAAVSAAIVAVTAVTLYRRARRPLSPTPDTASLSSAATTSPATIDAVERCHTPFDVTLPKAAEVLSASELRSDTSATIRDDEHGSS